MPISNYYTSMIQGQEKKLFPSVFEKNKSLGRGEAAALVVPAFVYCALDTIIGVGAGIAAICTAGRNQKLYNVAVNHLYVSNYVLSSPYKFLLKTINPDAYEPTPGNYVNRILEPIFAIARGNAGADNFLQRHVVSRLTFALAGIVAVIGKLVMGVLAIPTAALSILTAGRFRALNQLACQNLQFTGIVNDLIVNFIKILNPQSKSST